MRRTGRSIGKRLSLIIDSARLSPMRSLLPAALLLPLLLAACASQDNLPPSKHISQSGPLKVHPGLRGQPASADLPEQQTTPAKAPASGY